MNEREYMGFCDTAINVRKRGFEVRRDSNKKIFVFNPETKNYDAGSKREIKKQCTL